MDSIEYDDKIFLGINSKIKFTTWIIAKLNFIKMECICSVKGNNKKMGRKETDWEKTCANIFAS